MIAHGYALVDDGFIYAPAIRQRGFADYLAMHTLLRAHAKVYRLYEREFKPTYGGKLFEIPTSRKVLISYLSHRMCT